MDLRIAALLLRWHDLWPEGAPPGLGEALIQAWSKRGRHYHTLQHLMEMLEGLDRYGHLATHAREVALAIWFHDAIYRGRRHDNEGRSAAWARAALMGWLTEASVARIEAMILRTTGHTDPASADEGLLLDLDLAILGASPARFAEFERQVRAEYRWVPAGIYRRERGKILARFRASHPLYHTAEIRAEREQMAQRNLDEALTTTYRTA